MCSNIINFECLFRVCLKYFPRGHFGEHFWRFLEIFEDFGIPIGIPFGIVFLKKWDLKPKQKTHDFLVAGGRARTPRVGMIRNWSYPSIHTPASSASTGAAYPERLRLCTTAPVGVGLE